MRIDKIEIDNFGKFKDFSLDFTDGLNVIFGKNESGKSTICAFLQGMFYDFPNSKQSMTLREDYRRRYQPIDGALMSGTVSFTHNEKKYVLKRRIGKTSRGSKVQLYNGDTWEEINDIEKENIGKAFFGVGEDGFLKTLFIGQLGAKIEKGKNDEVIERLSNLSRSGSEDISYRKTMDELLKRQYALVSKSGTTGKIVHLSEENEKLLNLLEKAQRKDELLKETLNKKETAEAEKEKITELTKKQEEKKEKLLLKQKYLSKKEAEKIIALKETEKKEADSELLRSEKNIKELRKKKTELSFLDNVTDDTKRRLSELETENKILEEKLLLFDKKKEEYKKLEEEKEKLSSKNKRINYKSLAAAIIVLCISLVLSFAVGLPFLLLSLLSAVLFVLAFKKSADSKRYEELLILISGCGYSAEEHSQILIKQNKNRKQYENILYETRSYSHEDLVKKLSERDGFIKLLDSLEAENKLLKEKIQTIDNEIKKQKEIILSIGECKEILFDEEISDEDIEREQKSLSLNLIDCEKRIAEAESMLKTFNETEMSVSAIKSQILANETEKKELIKKYEAIKKAAELMEESYEELKSDFAPKLSKHAGNILSNLTNGKYTDVRVSDDYSLKVLSGKEIMDGDYLSSGTYDIIYLALRLGILGVLFDKIPMLILDDTFLQLDEERAKNAAEYIKSSNIAQVLYFTCHKSQMNILSGDNVNVINMPQNGDTLCKN